MFENLIAPTNDKDVVIIGTKEPAPVGTADNLKFFYQQYFLCQRQLIKWSKFRLKKKKKKFKYVHKTFFFYPHIWIFFFFYSPLTPIIKISHYQNHHHSEFKKSTFNLKYTKFFGYWLKLLIFLYGLRKKFKIKNFTTKKYVQSYLMYIGKSIPQYKMYNYIHRLNF